MMTAERPESWTAFLAAKMADDARMHRARPRIVIGVCTRQRNALLRRLIDSIGEQQIPSAYDVGILVVDNNDVPTATKALVGLSGQFPVTVVHEPQIGLVHARNRALDKAVARGADWFIGVDDDEWVADDWLARFIAAFETMRGPVLMAPCRYVYDDTLSPFLAPRQLPTNSRGARPAVMSTGNYALHRRVFDPRHGPGLRFDPAFNESGAEDLEFFLRAERTCGWVAAWVPDAVVFENWDGVRATLRYRMARSLRNQISAYQVARLHRRLGYHGSRLGNLVRVVMRVNRNMVLGTVSMAAGVALLPFAWRRGPVMIGKALERFVCAWAVLPFVFGASPVAYGARADAH